MKYLFLLFIFLPVFSFSQICNGYIDLDTNNVTVVKVWGTHYERGYAAGLLLADEIKSIYEGYIMPELGSNLSLAKSIIQDGSHISFDSKYITEAQGMIDGMQEAGISLPGVDYLDILVANSFLDIQGLGGMFSNLNMSNGCSSLLSWGQATINTELEGEGLISRHLDWSDDAALVNNQVIIVHFPDETDEQPWLMVGFAGQISALSGVNEEGLSVFQHNLSDFYGTASLGMGYEPIWISIRKALEQYDYNGDFQTDVNDVRAVLNDNNTGYADGYIVTALSPMVSAADSVTALVAELASSMPYHTYRSVEYPDSIHGQNLYAANYEIARNNHMHFCSRYNGVINGIGNGKAISVEKNWSIMRDYSNAGWSNIQFMQVIPSQRVLNLAVHNGTDPAYILDSVAFSLDDLFSLNLTERKCLDNKAICTVYPVPVKDYLNFNFESQENEVKLLSLTGNDLRSIHFSDYRGRLNMSNIPDGIYFINVYSAKNRNTSIKVVKISE